MELARCHECGSRIRGEDHEIVAGASRAQYLEN